MIKRLILLIALAPTLHAGLLGVDSPPYVPISPAPTPTHEIGVAPLPPQEFPYSNGNGRMATPPPEQWRPISPVQPGLEVLGQQLDKMNFFWVAGDGSAETFKALILEMGQHGNDYLLRHFFRWACSLVAAKIQPGDNYPQHVLTKALATLQWYGYENI